MELTFNASQCCVRVKLVPSLEKCNENFIVTIARFIISIDFIYTFQMESIQLRPVNQKSIEM